MLYFIIFLHLITCILVFIIQFADEEDPTLNWGYGIIKEDDDWNNYVTASYLVVTTVATVGYGDIHATNTLERIFLIILMVLGVTFFGLFSSALV